MQLSRPQIVEQLEKVPAAVQSVIPRTPRRPRIAVATFITDNKSYLHLSLSNKQRYCRKHGYDLIVDFEGDDRRGRMWHKLNLVERLIKAGEHDFIWFIDFDTLHMNMNRRVEDLIEEQLKRHDKPDDVHLFVTADCFPLNLGSMIFRSDPWVYDLFEIWRNYKDEFGDNLSEQDCLRDLLEKEEATLSPHIKYVPQYKMNAFPKEINCNDKESGSWRPGDLLIHFAGAWAHVKEDDPTGFLM